MAHYTAVTPCDDVLTLFMPLVNACVLHCGKWIHHKLLSNSGKKFRLWRRSNAAFNQPALCALLSCHMPQFMACRPYRREVFTCRSTPHGRSCSLHFSSKYDHYGPPVYKHDAYGMVAPIPASCLIWGHVTKQLCFCGT